MDMRLITVVLLQIELDLMVSSNGGPDESPDNDVLVDFRLKVST